jgi:hypothetical protein
MADQSWEKLATRAILFFSEVGHKTVGKRDSARTEMNQTLAIIARLRGEFLEVLVTTDINPDSEFAPLIAEKLVKAAVSFVGEDPPGWAAIILKLMAILEFQKPAQMERESVVVQRRTLGGALQVLNAIFGSAIGPAAHTRASSLLDQWSRKDQNFVQWAQIFGGTAEAGPQAFIEKVVIPKMNQWAGASRQTVPTRTTTRKWSCGVFTKRSLKRSGATASRSRVGLSWTMYLTKYIVYSK